ncbi:hypothetical protein M885DRAFT_520861 [Pelagophyceae sp. CCMP2097]|nr:hypothetical protein M885DRAFT_520861 [Pelagophyceae sp. CCMP2097]
MCLLWYYNRLKKHGICGLLPGCLCCGSLACVILGPLGAMYGLLLAFLAGALKLLPGIFSRGKGCYSGYCAVITAGQREYDAEAAPPQPQSSRDASAVDQMTRRFDRQTRSTGSKCAAEMYCCCFPAFVVMTFFIPVLMAVELLVCAPARGFCEGWSAGCAGTEGFVGRMAEVRDRIDHGTSLTAFGRPSRWLSSAPGAPAAPAPAPYGGAQSYGQGQPAQPVQSQPAALARPHVEPSAPPMAYAVYENPKT